MSQETPKEIPLAETEAVKPIELSPQTAQAVAGVIEKAANGQALTESDPQVVKQSVAQDLRGEGVDAEASSQPAGKIIPENGAIPIESVGQETPVFVGKEIPDNPFDIKKLEQTLDLVSRTYGQGPWKAIAGILCTDMVLANLESGISRGFWTNDNRVRSAWHKLNVDLLQRMTVVNTIPRSFGEISLSKLNSGQVKDLVGTVLRVGWPVWVPMVSSLIRERITRRLWRRFDAEIGKFQAQINSRVAQSLIMRDFAYLKDKPAAEITNIVNRGTQATLGLIETVYTELLPYLARLGSFPIRQAVKHPVEGVLALLKLPVLYASSKRHAREMLAIRAEELRRLDALNSRILATLESLDIIKTSDSQEAASQFLGESLAWRDFIRAGGMRRGKRKRKKSLGERTTDWLDVGVPAVMEGVDLYQEYNKKKELSLSLFGSGWTSYWRVKDAQAQQEAVKRIILDLSNIYVGKILPQIQDIEKMEELFGPYHKLDWPGGAKEGARLPVSHLTNLDLTVRNLSYSDILHSISLDLPQGSFTAIRGISGVGKTTLLQHLVGLLSASEGVVNFGGVDISRIKKFGPDSLYSQIGYANQNPQYFETISLRENLLMWIAREVTDEETKQVLHNLNLDHIIDRLDSTVKHFSGGELRRIGIARALLRQPKVLFMDEPTANLDPQSAKQVLDFIQQLRRERPEMTVVAVTHDPEFGNIADKVIDFAELNQKRAEAPPLNENQVLVGEGHLRKVPVSQGVQP